MKSIAAIIVLLLIAAWITSKSGSHKIDHGHQEREGEREFIKALRRHGPVSPNIICPHCHEKGKVHTRMISQKKGVSGGKATAALLTGGMSMLATGLSRKEKATKAYCLNCQSTWHF